MEESVIEVCNLSKKFKEHDVLQDIHLKVGSGEIFGIIGMSGAGKSTLLRCLTGLEHPTTGSIRIQGDEITTMKPVELSAMRKHVGMVFQHFHLFSSRTVGENIAYALEIHHQDRTSHPARVNELLELVGLSHKKHVYPAYLSGGEKQRVGIARALANHPKLLLCDEATSALDPRTTRDILELLHRLNKQLGLTIVIITHQLEVVKQICTKVAVLSHGKIVEEGDVTRLFSRPQHAVTKHLLHFDAAVLPESFKRDPAKRLIRLSFEGDNAKEPLISRMIRQYQVEANILIGGLDCVRQSVIGTLVLELMGGTEETEKALNFLRQNQVYCEELL